MTGFRSIKRALISVSDKTGLVEFAKILADHNIEILSTGGSAKALRDGGIPVTEVSDHTGFPEILDGRVKTLVPQIHGGILARRDDENHLDQLRTHKIAPIDLVAVNLYPFEATAAAAKPFADCIENIDIGGPALIRAAAKNHDFVTILTAPHHYDSVATELTKHGGTSLALRKTLAAEAYARTAAYDAAIAAWFAAQNGETYPATVTQIQGKDLSYNNFNDTDAAFECASEFPDPTIVIIKHANPCGVASAATPSEAWDLALACDPISAFGGVVALNRTLDEVTAAKIASIFTEVIIAPDATDGAKSILARKKNLRLLLTGGVPDPAAPGQNFKSLSGGFLLQSRDNGISLPATWKTVTERAPTEAEISDMLFAFRVCKHVKSNAIIFAKNHATLGIGAGQMNRIDSARLAVWKGEAAQHDLKNCAVASDAFFPFPDGLQAAIAAGAAAVIQPGGSIRDDEVIAAANAAGVTMVFTNMRHFRH